MFTFILTWTFRGRTVHTAFSHRYRRRRYGGKLVITPASVSAMEDLTAEEVGQLLGGN